MPFTKIGRNKYESPSGRTYNKKQVALYYAGGGHFPGQKGMRDQFPKNHNSPTAPGAAAKPSFVTSGTANAATSSTPTSVLAGTKQTFGPLAYTTQDQDQEYWSPDRVANREVARSRRDYNRRK